MKYAVEQIAEGILRHERRMLAKGISLIESTHPDDAALREELLSIVLPHSGKSKRIGITGSPGVGKSTLIESFGLHAIEQGCRIAVLAVDPTSSRSGGSILGDKVRMMQLSRSEQAFIRPSPSGGTLGGTTRRTRECIILCEAAGFDCILVETVGVGQSEYAVAQMVDAFILLMLPNAGDDIQGIKRGIMEMADILVVTKSDVSPEQANRAVATLHTVIRFLSPRSEQWKQTILSCSAVNNIGIDTLWNSCMEFFAGDVRTNAIAEQRKEQLRQWLHSLVSDEILRSFYQSSAVRELLPRLEREVMQHLKLPTSAMRELVSVFLQH